MTTRIWIDTGFITANAAVSGYFFARHWWAMVVIFAAIGLVRLNDLRRDVNGAVRSAKYTR